LIDVTQVWKADPAQRAFMTPERPERRHRTRSAEPHTDTRVSKSSTGKGKKTTPHHDRNRSTTQRDDRIVRVHPVSL